MYRSEERGDPMLTKEEAETRVARGAARLDQVRPNWFREIDPGTLRLADPCQCIVGQLLHGECTFGLFKREAQRVLELDPVDDRAQPWSFGVDIHISDLIGIFHGFTVLQAAWIAAIADRLIPHTPEPPQTADAGHEALAEQELTPRV
jgi:hypothetical protein